jgi:hypothetical protein
MDPATMSSAIRISRSLQSRFRCKMSLTMRRRGLRICYVLLHDAMKIMSATSREMRTIFSTSGSARRRPLAASKNWLYRSAAEARGGPDRSPRVSADVGNAPRVSDRGLGSITTDKAGQPRGVGRARRTESGYMQFGIFG